MDVNGDVASQASTSHYEERKRRALGAAWGGTRNSTQLAWGAGAGVMVAAVAAAASARMRW